MLPDSNAGAIARGFCKKFLVGEVSQFTFFIVGSVIVHAQTDVKQSSLRFYHYDTGEALPSKDLTVSTLIRTP